jgi:protein-L-isoaspartate(D-aspartate) O-methyltransferase
MDNLDLVRRFYAEEIRAVANVQSDALIDAFAKVPRESFLGAGPWQITSYNAGLTGEDYRTTKDDDPKHIYHNVLVVIEQGRHLNGQPSGLARWLDALNLCEGERVFHVGCGVGYYTAIVAEVVGSRGHVVAIELDAAIAARARKNLAHLKHVELIQGDACDYDPVSCDAIFVNAGVANPRMAWLESLKPHGRLVLPLSTCAGRGAMLRVTREDAGYGARFLFPVTVSPGTGFHEENANQLLHDAFRDKSWKAVQSLRHDPHPPHDTCWLHGDDFCLSTLSLDVSSR